MTQTCHLDRIDRKILTILQQDGRLTNQRLADLVALSPSACLARVRRLEREAVITGYRAQVDPTRLGACLIVFAELTVAAHDVGTTRRLEEALRAMPEAVEAYQVSGSYDFLVRFLVPDMGSWTQLAEDLAGGELKVDTVKTIAVMRVLKAWNGVPT